MPNAFVVDNISSCVTAYSDIYVCFCSRLHLDEAHNPGPPDNHIGWSSFPEEMADANASARADYDFFDAVQASNVPESGDGVVPDPAIQGVSCCCMFLSERSFGYWLMVGCVMLLSSCLHCVGELRS